jgi:hypothetical protein
MAYTTRFGRTSKPPQRFEETDPIIGESDARLQRDDEDWKCESDDGEDDSTGSLNEFVVEDHDSNPDDDPMEKDESSLTTTDTDDDSFVDEAPPPPPPIYE